MGAGAGLRKTTEEALGAAATAEAGWLAEAGTAAGVGAGVGATTGSGTGAGAGAACGGAPAGPWDGARELARPPWRVDALARVERHGARSALRAPPTPWPRVCR